MEALLRLSGLLGEDDAGKTDLGTLEKRLADKRASSIGPASNLGSPISPSMPRPDRSMSDNNTPLDNDESSPNTVAPTPDGSGTRGLNAKQVEALADQMCSLVTNTSGETRYIGKHMLEKVSCLSVLTCCRLLFWLLNILSKRYPMGQREDGRQVFPRHDLASCH